MSIIAISAGLGSPSASQMLAKRIIDALHAARPQRQGDEIRLVELRDIARELLNAELTHMPSPAVRRLTGEMARADALVVVTPVYNAQPAAILSLLLEVVDKDSLRGTPVLLGATGGTPRHSLVLDRALVPLFHYLHAVVAPVSVYAATEDWASNSLDERVHRAADSLLDLLNLPAGGPSDPPATGIPQAYGGPGLDDDFETMLAQVEAGGHATTR